MAKVLSVLNKFNPKVRVALWLSGLIAILLLMTGIWIGWGDWPSSGPSGKPSNPDVIIVLGGGDESRPREALRLSNRFPQAKLVVTGDGGQIFAWLKSRIIINTTIENESLAGSTWENALYCRPWLERPEVREVVLVTNDFHCPRARAVFERHYPNVKFVMAAEVTQTPYNKWQEQFRRRERKVAVYYLLRHRIWSF